MLETGIHILCKTFESNQKHVFFLAVYHCESSTNALEHLNNNIKINVWVQKSQLAFTCSKLTIETLEQGLKYVQS